MTIVPEFTAPRVDVSPVASIRESLEVIKFAPGAIPSRKDVEAAAKDFALAAAWDTSINSDYVPNDKKSYWTEEFNRIRTEVIFSPGSIGTKSTDLLAAKRRALLVEEAKESGAEDITFHAANWWRKFDTTVYTDEDGQYQFYEVIDRDNVGRPLEIIDCVNGEVFTKDNTKNKRAVDDWSRRSRSLMGRKLNTLDLSTFARWVVMPALPKLRVGKMSFDVEGPRNAIQQGQLGMITLTLPGEWLSVAPSGKAFKRLFSMFKKRWMRNVGEWRCMWKLEFQRRGAPHLHILAFIPQQVNGVPFEAWLSEAWSEVVDHQDADERAAHLRAGTAVDFKSSKMTDGREIVSYFIGHSSKSEDGKEYQHIVPEAWRAPGMGPGRFWGFNGLDSVTYAVEVNYATRVKLDRELRKLRRARDFRAALRLEASKAKRSGKPVKSAWDTRRKVGKKLTGNGRRGSWSGGTVIVKNSLEVGRAYGLWLHDMNLAYDFDGSQVADKKMRSW